MSARYHFHYVQQEGGGHCARIHRAVVMVEMGDYFS